MLSELFTALEDQDYFDSSDDEAVASGFGALEEEGFGEMDEDKFGAVEDEGFGEMDEGFARMRKNKAVAQPDQPAPPPPRRRRGRKVMSVLRILLILIVLFAIMYGAFTMLRK